MEQDHNSSGFVDSGLRSERYWREKYGDVPLERLSDSRNPQYFMHFLCANCHLPYGTHYQRSKTTKIDCGKPTVPGELKGLRVYWNEAIQKIKCSDIKKTIKQIKDEICRL